MSHTDRKDANVRWTAAVMNYS